MSIRELLLGTIAILIVAGSFALGKASATCDPQADFVING